ncbi:MAG: response regulator [Gammaproteobacteria bacterium]|nr:response regulator [Gammaproteobacteria bacterium]
MKVLVVEDSARLQDSMSAGLQAFGYAVDVVDEGTKAISYASNHDYDVIILDLMLPKESSLLVLHEIRELDREVDILILSARDQIHDRVTALIQGADDYLVKPFSCDDLHARIQSLVRRRVNPKLPADDREEGIDPTTHLNRLIQNLLQQCHCDHGEIELVISEIKFSKLLNRVSSKLRKDAEQNEISLQLPAEKLPTLLVDAKWMEHLLANLIMNAISHSPAGSEIRIEVQAGAEYCAVEIENPMSKSLTSDELKTMFKDFYNGNNNDGYDGPLARFSLVKSYADLMNLKLNASIENDNRFRIRVSNIKLV